MLDVWRRYSRYKHSLHLFWVESMKLDLFYCYILGICSWMLNCWPLNKVHLGKWLKPKGLLFLTKPGSIKFYFKYTIISSISWAYLSQYLVLQVPCKSYWRLMQLLLVMFVLLTWMNQVGTTAYRKSELLSFSELRCGLDCLRSWNLKETLAT